MAARRQCPRIMFHRHALPRAEDVLVGRLLDLHAFQGRSVTSRQMGGLCPSCSRRETRTGDARLDGTYSRTLHGGEKRPCVTKPPGGVEVNLQWPVASASSSGPFLRPKRPPLAAWIDPRPRRRRPGQRPSPPPPEACSKGRLESGVRGQGGVRGRKGVRE